MKVFRPAITLLALLAFCACTRTQEFSGKVTAASPESVPLLSGDGTSADFDLTLADPSEIPGLLPGDVVSLQYRPVELPGGVTLRPVVRLKITSPSWFRLIPGTWTMSGVNDSDRFGFTLEEDGSAASVNLNTSHITSWALRSDTLYLTSWTEADGPSGARTHSWIVEKLDADSLVLRGGPDSTGLWRCRRSK